MAKTKLPKRLRKKGVPAPKRSEAEVAYDEQKKTLGHAKFMWAGAAVGFVCFNVAAAFVQVARDFQRAF